MDVGVWLRSLGLGQYEATFRDNEIDGAVLPKLTVEDLKDLGVSVVGHRRKIMFAIEELNAVARTDDTESLPTQAALPVSTSHDGAERRPITVMFCDLVGSTSLAARLDAEDWRNLVDAYLDEASKAVTGLGGHVLKKLGDGLMALFGYPQAQENDAERAVRAALAIQRALADLNARNARTGRARARRPHRPRVRAPSWSTRPAKCSARRRTSPRGSRRRPSRGRCSSPRACSDRRPGCSSPRTAARTSSKACLEPVTLYRIVRASGAGRRGGARALTPARRARGRARTSQPALGARAQGRGSACAHRRRAGLGQVAADRRVSRPPRRDAAHLGRVVVVATAAEYAAAPRRRMGTAALWRRRHARRTATSPISRILCS